MAAGFGTVDRVGVEGTGAYGAGLARHLRGRGLMVIEVDRPNRQDRRRNGKSDRARRDRSGAGGVVGPGVGDREDPPMATSKRSARCWSRAARAATYAIKYLNQIRHLGFTAPDELRERFRDVPIATVSPARAAALRPNRRRRHGRVRDEARDRDPRPARPRARARQPTPRRRARRRSCAATAPSLLEVYGVGIHTAAILLVAAGDNPHRLQSEAAFAHLCGVAPLPASSGKIDRHRLNPGGNRQANHALWRIVFTRMSSDERTRKYVARRTAEGTPIREIMRVLKRYVAREVYPLPRTRLTKIRVAGLTHECPDTDRLSFERSADPPPRTITTRHRVA